jgi:hypothetical protein
MEIPHRKKDEPSKLVTQLRLYRVLYENWNGRENYRDIAGEGQEDNDPGVPLADLQRLPDAKVALLPDGQSIDLGGEPPKEI